MATSSDSGGMVALLLASFEGVQDVSQGPLLLRLVWALLGVSIVVVLARLWAKWKTARRLYYDDAFMVLAVVFGIVHAVIITIAVDSGFGKHIIYLTGSLSGLEKTMKYGVLSLLFGFLGPMFGRISFCCTLLFLTGADPRVRKWPVLVFIFLQASVNVVGVILFYVQCGSNVDTFWNIQKQLYFSDYCWDPVIQTRYGYFMGSVNTATDCFLAALPAVLIEHTKLSRKTKLGLACLLCLSVLAMVAAIVKTYEAKMLSEVTDYTYNLCSYVIWVSVELNIVIITASIPLLRPLFRRKKSQINGLDMEPPVWRTHVQLGSMMSLSKNSSRNHTQQQVSISSFDAIMPDSLAGITVTTEVELSYEARDAPFVHAALVGLVQGEIQNPRVQPWTGR